MDKVRPETQSEHTPQGPTRAVDRAGETDATPWLGAGSADGTIDISSAAQPRVNIAKKGFVARPRRPRAKG